jgi:lipopolysaccharide/colanic/teichoic acid biosynthesis glycosyltransferase
MAVLQNNPTFRTVYPNKIFDYMACAKPTVLAIDGVARKLVCDEARAGVFAEPESGKELSAAIRALADDPDGRKAMGNRGRDWVQANASREALAAKYLDVMRELLPAVSVRPGYGAAKRTLDVISAFLLLAILSPVLIVAMLAVRLTLGSPAVFSQSRLGYRDRPFLSYKLRTMTDRRGADGQLLPDEQRLTALGRFLRASSLDELPQLWNVLKGEMSLVGPRPLMVKYLPRYTSRQRQRHQVMPGITGWAQIHGRNTLDWEERFELDLWYVQNRSLWLDLKILTITVTKVLRRDGVNRPGHATMPEFLGPEAGASSRAAGSGN